METNELKPCPFCGNIPTIKICGDMVIIECSNHDWSKPGECGFRIAGDIDICADILGGKYNFRTNEYEYSHEEMERCKNAAIKAWNIRADRTCTFSVYKTGDDHYPTCSACGYEAAREECEDYVGVMFYEKRFCPNCGSKVIRNAD